MRLMSSATARMPPYDSRLKSPRDLSFCSRIVVILLMISGEIGAQRSRQRTQERCSLGGVEMCEDERDGLRLL
jgi:hypothetical protein